MVKKFLNKKGQSTLEYILLVTAVVAVAIIFLRPSTGGVLFDQVDTTLNESANQMNTMTGRMAGFLPTK